MDGAHGARTDGHGLRLPDTGIDAALPDASVGLGMVVRDLARALAAEMALLAVPGENGRDVEVLAAWGAAGTDDGLPAYIPAGGFVGRALGFESPTVEPLDTQAAGLAKPSSGDAGTMVNLPHDPIDASVGVAQWRVGSSLQMLLGAADRGLLAAKTSGGGRVVGASAPTVRERPVDSIAHLSHATSVEEVLVVAVQFEESGGSSMQLAAWELDTELADVVSAWSHAIKQGFLEPAGTDPVSGEEMWHLTERGRRAAGTRPGPDPI